MTYIDKRTTQVDGSAPVPQNGNAEFCGRDGDFTISSGRECPMSQQGRGTPAGAATGAGRGGAGTEDPFSADGTPRVKRVEDYAAIDGATYELLRSKLMTTTAR